MNASNANPRAGAWPWRIRWWRILTWMLLLLAAFGILQYTAHAWQVAAVMRGGQGGPDAPLLGMLLWDIAYLVGACITLSAAAGALLRREWARRLLRVVAVVLAIWALATAIGLVAHWLEFQRSSSALLAQTGVDAATRALLERVHRTFIIGIALKLVAVPLLAWLAWRLGRPVVREQFRVRAERPATT